MSMMQDVAFSIRPETTRDVRYVYAELTMPCISGTCEGEIRFTGKNVGYVTAGIFTPFVGDSPDDFNRPESSYQGVCPHCGNVMQLTNYHLKELRGKVVEWASNFLANEAKAVAL